VKLNNTILMKIAKSELLGDLKIYKDKLFLKDIREKARQRLKNYEERLSKIN
jgi:hypothetical protein